MNNIPQSIIGALLQDESLIPRARDLVNLSRIENSKDREILEAIFAHRSNVDITTLMDVFCSDSTIGGYLYDCRQGCYAPENIEIYISLLDKNYNKKQLQLAVNKLQQQLALDDESALYNFNEAAKQIEANCEVHLRSISDIVDGTINEMEDAASQKMLYTGTPCGFRAIDDILCGMQKQNLIVIAGRTGMGKTFLALNMAMNISVLGNLPVLFVSLEMTEKELCRRMLSRMAMVSSNIIKSAKFDNQHWQKIMEAALELKKSKFYIEDKPAMTLAEIRTKARRIQQRHGLAAIFIDYLSLIGERGDNEILRHGIISHGLKAMAKDFDIPVIALSQLNREAEKEKPIMSHIRNSGEIEQDADVVMLLYREEVYKPNLFEIKNIADIEIAKHRSGCTGSVKLGYDFDKCAFFNLEK